ncbi:MAG: N-acetylneuraminate synthase [Lentisphaerae bacterium GWF2_44_16]|nr:MAG: N-acetylneuraminate synthase [Lentisphaerae bacterium GWF2_44_16]
MYKEPILIAEIGCNHKGDMDIAREMIDTAHVFCKVKYVKFQKRCLEECLTPSEFSAPHPNPANSYGKTYGEHRKFLEFDLAQHRELKEYCESKGMVYFSSVWDITSAKEMTSLKPEIIKVPSACSTHLKLIEVLCGEFGGEIHIALGMTSRKEEEELVSFIEKKNRIKDTVLYHCISGYPVPFDNMSLMEIVRLKKTYGGKVKDIGFSGHHLGIAIDVAAYTLGANYIERHYTLDRTWKGTDHAASLEPEGMRKLKRDLLAAYKSLSYRKEEILEIEKEQRLKLKWDRK